MAAGFCGRNGNSISRVSCDTATAASMPWRRQLARSTNSRFRSQLRLREYLSEASQVPEFDSNQRFHPLLDVPTHLNTDAGEAVIVC